MARLFRFVLVLLFLAGITGAGAWFYGQFRYGQPGPKSPDGAARTVLIGKGASAAGIAQTLHEVGAVSNAMEFRVALKALETLSRFGVLPEDAATLKAGEYSIPSGASMQDIVKRLGEGQSIQYAVIVPEGLTSAAVVDLLMSKSWKSTGKSGQTIQLAGEAPTIPAEGSLLPGDYMVQRGETVHSVVERMAAAQQELTAKLWPPARDDLPFKTLQEAIILASIVEKETGVPNERPQVASVFYNRLTRTPPMRLQTDPTIIYGVCLRRPASCKDGKLVDEKGNRRPILKSEIELDTGYNTYRIDGLPPTPICNPGRASIEAVFDPPKTDYLFFVADGTGGHAFAATNAEHERNRARWEQVEAGRLAEEKANALSAPSPM